MDLLAVWDRLDQARAEARKAGAALIPTLSVQASAGLSIDKSGPTGSFLLGAAASYEIDLWGRIRSTRRAAIREAQATAESLKAAAISLSAEVAIAFYQLAEAYGQIELLQKQHEANRQMTKLVSLRLGIGQASAVDVLQQTQLVESTRGELYRARGAARILEHRLSVLLGSPPGAAVDNRKAVLIQLPPLPSTGIPTDLIKRRPDVLSAYLKVAAANERVAAAVADRFPALSLSAGAQVSSDKIRKLFDNWIINLAANLLAPILDYSRRKAEVVRARAAASEALHAYGKTVLSALREVEDALVNERHGLDRKKSIEAQLELSKLAVSGTLDRFLYGAEQYLRVLDAQIKHQTLERSYLTLRRELIENRIALCRALAGGWSLKRPAKKQRGGRPR